MSKLVITNLFDFINWFKSILSYSFLSTFTENSYSQRTRSKNISSFKFKIKRVFMILRENGFKIVDFKPIYKVRERTNNGHKRSTYISLLARAWWNRFFKNRSVFYSSNLEINAKLHKIWYKFIAMLGW